MTATWPGRRHMLEKRLDPTGLTSALRDGDVHARWRAVVEIGRTGGREERGHLVTALASDPSARVREEAARTLGTLRWRTAVPALIEALRGDRGAHVREAAAEALGRIADERASEALNEALGDRHTMVRLEARRALERIARAREGVSAEAPAPGVPRRSRRVRGSA